MKNLETLIGAFVAALILFISSITTLFMENPELTFGAIRQATWVSIIGGAVVAFLKDYQAITARRIASKLTGRAPYEPSPPN